MNQEQNLYRKTPIMGWSSWNCFRVDINEEKLKQQADALVSTGLASYGYEYFNIDDGYFGGRGEDGRLRYHPTRFPNGIRVISDYAHKLGLHAGIYTEAGKNTCGFYWDQEGENGTNAGLYGHDEQDLHQLLVEGNFDFIKVDYCGANKLGLDEEERYTAISRIIDRIRHEENRSIVYNVCRWEFPGEWVVDIADSWRTGGDIRPDFDSILYQIDKIKPLRKYCGPGHVNDLDMMQVGNGLTPEEERTHFAMWCMMSTPLMIGCDLCKIPEYTLETLKNRELIALDQDPACLQAYMAKSICGADGKQDGEVWIKDLGCENSVRKAAAFLNRSEKPLTITASLAELGLCGKVLSIRNLCTHEDLAPSDSFSFTVVPHGVCVLKIEAEGSLLCYFEENIPVMVHDYPSVSYEKAKALIKDGARLIDVRTEEEFNTAHLPDAENLPYAALDRIKERMNVTESTPLIVYCSTGKRSSQAKEALEYKGFTDVFYLGAIDPTAFIR